MKKKDIIKKSEEFTNIIKKGRKVKNNYYSIYYIENKKQNRYGITVPTKTGNAVCRNKLKRQIKNIIDKNDVQKAYDYVIIIKKEIINLSYQEKEKELLKLFQKIGANIWKRKYY